MLAYVNQWGTDIHGNPGVCKTLGSSRSTCNALEGCTWRPSSRVCAALPGYREEVPDDAVLSFTAPSEYSTTVYVDKKGTAYHLRDSDSDSDSDDDSDALHIISPNFSLAGKKVVVLGKNHVILTTSTVDDHTKTIKLAQEKEITLGIVKDSELIIQKITVPTGDYSRDAMKSKLIALINAVYTAPGNKKKNLYRLDYKTVNGFVKTPKLQVLNMGNIDETIQTLIVFETKTVPLLPVIQPPSDDSDSEAPLYDLSEGKYAVVKPGGKMSAYVEVILKKDRTPLIFYSKPSASASFASV